MSKNNSIDKRCRVHGRRSSSALAAGLSLMLLASSCRAADSSLVRELRRKGRDQGLGLIRVLNFISDEITFDPEERRQKDPFSWWYLMNITSSPDGTSLIGIYDPLESGRKFNHPPPEDLLAGRVKRLPPGIVLVDPNGKERWHATVMNFHLDANISITARGDKVALQGREGLACFSVASSELHIVDSTAGESHFTSHRVAWSPAGDQIVYERDGAILIYDLASKPIRQLARGFEPSWSPDGKWVAFQSPEGNGELIKATGGDTKLLTLGHKLSGALRWSPDSEYLLCSVNDASPIRMLTQLTSQLVIYRVSDGAQYAVVSAIPVGVGEAFEWTVKKPKSAQ